MLLIPFFEAWVALATSRSWIVACCSFQSSNFERNIRQQRSVAKLLSLSLSLSVSLSLSLVDVAGVCFSHTHEVIEHLLNAAAGCLFTGVAVTPVHGIGRDGLHVVHTGVCDGC